MNEHTFRSASLAALLVLGAFATGCAFDPDAPSADGEADERESIGTTQQAAIVYRGGAGVAPGCGSRVEGADQLCYVPCKDGYWGQVTRCREQCSIYTNRPCSVPEKAYDRGPGIPKSCALLGRVEGKDGKCYGLTSTSGPIEPPATTGAPAAPAPVPVSAAANKCIHTFDSSGRAMVWSNGWCLTWAEYQASHPTNLPAQPPEEEPCLLVGGCGWTAPTGPYDSPYSSTNHVTTTGHDLLGYE